MTDLECGGWCGRFAHEDETDWPIAVKWDPTTQSEIWQLTLDWAREVGMRIEQAAACVGHLDTALLEPFLWRVQYAVGMLVWQPYLERADKYALIRTLPDLVHAACSVDALSAAVFQFWDGVQELREGYGDDPAVANAIFEALQVQLSKPNHCSQLSALHGMNHLQDPRTVEVVSRLASTWVDPEIAAYAEGAMRFEAV